MKTLEERVKNLEDAVRKLAIAMCLAVLLAILLLATSCTPTAKMVMPDGCKPAKKAKYEIIKPEPKIERDGKQNN